VESGRGGEMQVQKCFAIVCRLHVHVVAIETLERKNRLGLAMSYR